MQIEIGTGVTLNYWTDRKAATVVRVSPSGKTVWVREDFSKRVDSNGMSECQSYEYSPNPEAREQRIFLRNDGRWYVVGESTRVTAGRNTYHDFSF